MRPRRGRMPMRERLQRNLRAMEFQSTTGTNPGIEALRARIAALPPKRDRIRRPVDGKPVVPLEKHVLAEVLDALRQDPRVALVDRRQSGVFQEGERYIRVGTRGTLDISGMLIGGIYFEVECKRPGQKPDARQANRIEAIRRNGGIAGYATSAEEAIALLP